MDNRDDIREFLVSRRARITPQQAGLTVYGTNRRVPGLRREEAALLAGVSIDYYTQLERGRLAGASEAVLDAIARALQLDEAERSRLFDLARTAGSGPRQRRRPTHKIRPGLQQVLDALADGPAFIRNGRLDVLAANDLGRALYAPAFDTPHRPVNLARFCFLDPRAHDFYPSWDAAADTSVAILRTGAGRDPYDRDLSDLIGELSTRSDDFRTRWAAHDVRLHHTGSKGFHHPEVGHLPLDFEAFALPGDPGLTLTVYTAPTGTPAHDALRLLASCAATLPTTPADTTRT
ncbi:helix-turn-helix transcriptional regulator [Actinocorallia aurea]